MTWLLKILGGGAGGWILAAALLAAAAAGGGAAYVARGVIDAPLIAAAKQQTAEADTRTAQCVTRHEKGRADGAETVISALLASAKVATGIVDDLARKAAARNQSLDQLLTEIAHAPPSKICGGSAAELAYRRSVQPSAAAAP